MYLNVNLVDFWIGNEKNILSHTSSFLSQFSKNDLGFNSDSFLLLMFNAELILFFFIFQKTFSWNKISISGKTTSQ